MLKIQYLNGGLANQVFQYIFFRYAELSGSSDDVWFLDDSFFFINDIHNGYELEKVFHLHPRLLSQHFDNDVWEVLIRNKQQGISVPQSFLDLGFPIKMIAEFDNYKEHNPFNGTVLRIPGNDFIPEITTCSDEYLYYHGYWLHPDWFLAHEKIFRKELSFPDISLSDSMNIEYASHILKSKSVGVHIRRGDYVTLGWESKNEFYLENIRRVLAIYPEAVFFVFSDDINWCYENKEAMGLHLPVKTVFVTGNTHGNNYIDLQLMCMCDIMIIGKSGFGGLALLLNEKLEYCFVDELPR